MNNIDVTPTKGFPHMYDFVGDSLTKGSPIVLIVLPILLPLVQELGFNLTWFAILVAVNLQTAWLSPPVALSAYFLKGVVPEWDLKDIYYGMMQFMVLQIIGLVLIIIFPKIALWLPTLLYGQ